MNGTKQTQQPASVVERVKTQALLNAPLWDVRIRTRQRVVVRQVKAWTRQQAISRALVTLDALDRSEVATVIAKAAQS